jgi:hypothetical protein
MKSADRQQFAPQIRSHGIGFRIVCEVSSAAPKLANATATSVAMQEAEGRLKQKGLNRRMGYFLLPDEATFIRYCTTLERLRASCFHAQKEYQAANRLAAHADSAQAGAVQARMQARNHIGYSDTWREHWNAVRASNQASDAAILAQLSKDDAQRWLKDAQDDMDSAVELFARQIATLQDLYHKLSAEYAKLNEDLSVKNALAAMNDQGNKTYRLGPTPTAMSAVKKLEHEESLLAQFKKQ